MRPPHGSIKKLVGSDDETGYVGTTVGVSTPNGEGLRPKTRRGSYGCQRRAAFRLRHTRCCCDAEGGRRRVSTAARLCVV